MDYLMPLAKMLKRSLRGAAAGIALEFQMNTPTELLAG